MKNIYIDDDNFEKLKKLSKKELRPMKSMLIIILNDYFKNHNKIKDLKDGDK